MAKRCDYSEEDYERGMQALALWQGNRERAAEMLREAGHPIPASTLRDWRNRDPERYARARQAVQEKVWAETGEEWQAFQRQAIATGRKFVAKSDELLEEGNFNDATKAARAAQSLGVTGGISADKTAGAQQRPTVPPEGRSLPELIRALSKFEAVLPGLRRSPLLEATAVEIPKGDGE